MDLTTILETFISSIFVGTFFVYYGCKLFNKCFKLNYKLIITTILLIIFVTFNYLFLDNILKTTFLYLTVLLAYKILFDKIILRCAVASFISYLNLVLGEVIFIIIISILSLLGVAIDISSLLGAITTNVIIVFFALTVGRMMRNKVSMFLQKIKDYSKITLIITFSLLLAVFCSLFYKVYFHKCEFDIYLIFNVLLVITLAYIAYVVLKQYYDKIRLGDEYEKYVEYSKQSEKLVDQYSISQHENKNELIIIRSMVHKNNNKLLEYLDEIIASKDNIDEAWIRHLRYLPFGGLKGIIHNKISEMKDNGINVFLNISKKIGRSKLKDLTIKNNNQLSKIVGVFLDNAKDAALCSQEKEVSLCAYVDNNEIVFEISNTYLDKTDLSKISQPGVTTKGKGHGYGLTLVDSILRENKMFQNETKQIDKYFIQILKITI